jgi:hypothetical protein
MLILGGRLCSWVSSQGQYLWQQSLERKMMGQAFAGKLLTTGEMDNNQGRGLLPKLSFNHLS